MPDLVSLARWHTLELRPTAPFHFDATMHKPDHFPSADNAWQPGVRWQTMRWQGRPLGLKLADHGTVEWPSISLEVWAEEELPSTALDGLVAEIRYRCNLDLDLLPFYESLGADPQLGPAIARWRGMRPASYSSLYEYLIIAIVLQNATVRRSVNMMQALFDAYGTRLSYDGRTLDCFWTPESLAGVTEEDLRRLKVGYRARAIARVTGALSRGEVDELALRQASPFEQRQALLALYGIGPASVWYILFDVFHHWDELNHISPWEGRIYSRLFFGRNPGDPVPAAQILSTLDERFGAWKMLAVHYIWEDLFWQRAHQPVPWLEELIRL